MLAQLTTYVADVSRRLLEQYRRKPKLVGLLEVAAAQAQELEGQLWLMLLQTSIGYFGPPVVAIDDVKVSDTASGSFLDWLGARVGEARTFGDVDGVYAVKIAKKVLVNRSQGTIPDLLAILEVGTIATPERITERYPAGLEIDLGQEIDLASATTAARFIRGARAAGVGVMVFHNEQNNALTFTFSSSAALQPSAFEGFGNSSNPATGGAFAGAIRA